VTHRWFFGERLVEVAHRDHKQAASPELPVHLRQCLWDIRLVEEVRDGVVARDHDIEQIFDLAQIAEVSDRGRGLDVTPAA
jgi:hypothetical protein